MNDANHLHALQSTLVPIIAALEAERQRVVKASLQNGIAVAILLGIMALLVTSRIPGLPKVLLLLLLLIGLAFIALFHSNNAGMYRAAFKSQVISHIVASLGHDLHYSPEGYVSENDFRVCQLFREPDRYNGEDLVSGCVGATQLQFSEIHAEYRTRDSKGRDDWNTIFRGLFFIADFNKHFNGMTLVQPDTAERVFGKFGQSLQAFGSKLGFSNRELVKLEDPEFERMFVVYSNDQIEARYILSPALMRRILDFRNRIGADFRIAFFANHIYLAIPLNTNFLEPPTFGKQLDVNCIGQYLAELQFAIGIVEDLDLNTRIWTKQ